MFKRERDNALFIHVEWKSRASAVFGMKEYCVHAPELFQGSDLIIIVVLCVFINENEWVDLFAKKIT